MNFVLFLIIWIARALLSYSSLTYCWNRLVCHNYVLGYNKCFFVVQNNQFWKAAPMDFYILGKQV